MNKFAIFFGVFTCGAVFIAAISYPQLQYKNEVIEHLQKYCNEPTDGNSNG